MRAPGPSEFRNKQILPSVAALHSMITAPSVWPVYCSIFIPAPTNHPLGLTYRLPARFNPRS